MITLELEWKTISSLQSVLVTQIHSLYTSIQKLQYDQNKTDVRNSITDLTALTLSLSHVCSCPILTTLGKAFTVRNMKNLCMNITLVFTASWVLQETVHKIYQVASKEGHFFIILYRTTANHQSQMKSDNIKVCYGLFLFRSIYDWRGRWDYINYVKPKQIENLILPFKTIPCNWLLTY